MTHETLAQLFRNRRRELGLLQSEVAKKCGVVPEFICQLEAGKRRPSLDLLPALAAALDLDLGQLCVRTLEEVAPVLCDALLRC